MTRALLAAALGCPAPSDPPDPTTPSAGCGETPCGPEVASASIAGGAPGLSLGMTLAVGEVQGQPVVMTGGPVDPGWYSIARVVVTDPALATLGTILTDELDDPYTAFGAAIALAPGGERFAVSARSGAEGRTQLGAVYLFDALPTDVVDGSSASAVLHGTDAPISALGAYLLYSDVGNGPELFASAPNDDDDREPGRVWVFDPSVTGEHGVEVAARRIQGDGVGGSTAAWDSDGDGLDELLLRLPDRVLHFPSPQVGDLGVDDADMVVTGRSGGDYGLRPVGSVGDLDGDGRDDLALAAADAEGVAYRSGTLFVVPGGTLASVDAEDLPMRIDGTTGSAYVGSSASGADLDGDGQGDLVVGAAGGWPDGTAGQVLGFVGPLGRAAYTEQDASGVVHGDVPYAYFGRSVGVRDVDGDGRDDAYVGSPGGGDDGAGRVYLLPSASLAP